MSKKAVEEKKALEVAVEKAQADTIRKAREDAAKQERHFQETELKAIADFCKKRGVRMAHAVGFVVNGIGFIPCQQIGNFRTAVHTVIELDTEDRAPKKEK